MARKGGFIRPGYDPLLVPNPPEVPDNLVGGDAQITGRTRFPATYNSGGNTVTTVWFVTTPDQLYQSAAAPTITPGLVSTDVIITVTGATNGTSYTLRAFVENSYGPSAYTAQSNSIIPLAPRGLFGGGTTGSYSNTIDYITIGSVGNATDFGDLTVAREEVSACSSASRGLFGGGFTGARQNVIDYITIATVGNATDFGDLTVAGYSGAACSSSTRGLFGGSNNLTSSNVIDYVTIASVGNATDFGDLTVSRNNVASCSSSTRGVFGGGFTSVVVNVIDYVTIASTGNATDFGDLTVSRRGAAACSSSTRGLFGGGVTLTNVIDYITIATVGNATDFGDLTGTRWQAAACSSSTRGVFGGGNTSAASPVAINVIDYVTIAAVGNATDFGDLTVARNTLAGCSNAHGGL